MRGRFVRPYRLGENVLERGRPPSSVNTFTMRKAPVTELLISICETSLRKCELPSYMTEDKISQAGIGGISVICQVPLTGTTQREVRKQRATYVMRG